VWIMESSVLDFLHRVQWLISKSNLWNVLNASYNANFIWRKIFNGLKQQLNLYKLSWYIPLKNLIVGNYHHKWILDHCSPFLVNILSKVKFYSQLVEVQQMLSIQNWVIYRMMISLVFFYDRHKWSQNHSLKLYFSGFPSASSGWGCTGFSQNVQERCTCHQWWGWCQERKPSPGLPPVCVMAPWTVRRWTAHGNPILLRVANQGQVPRCLRTI